MTSSISNYKIVVLDESNLGYFLSSLCINYENAKKRLKSLTLVQWQDITFDYNYFLKIAQNKGNIFVMFTMDDVVVASFRLLIVNEPTYNEIYDGNFKYDNYCTIHSICVNEEYLNQGIAKDIVDYSLMVARSMEFKSSRIDTHPRNTIMQRVIEKCEYTYSGIIYLDKEKNDKTIRYVYERLI